MRRRRPLPVILLVLACVASAPIASGCTAAPETPSTSASTADASSPSPVPTVTDTAPTAAAPATCPDLITPALADVAGANGWVGWTLPRDGVVFDPFASLPGGSPEDALVCRFGAHPDLATDNVLDLAWAPLSPDDSGTAQESLAANGFDLLPSSLGAVYAAPAEQGVPADDEGYAAAYLFTDDGVRWAGSRAHLEYFALSTN